MAKGDASLLNLSAISAASHGSARPSMLYRAAAAVNDPRPQPAPAARVRSGQKIRWVQGGSSSLGLLLGPPGTAVQRELTSWPR